MKLITHTMQDGSAACVCVSSYDERSIPAQAGFIWNQIVPKAWATQSARTAAQLWMHADEITTARLLKASVITQAQADQRLADLAAAPAPTKRDRAEEMAVRLASRPDLITAIHSLLRYLAARCDGAVAEDGRGFNGTDQSFGHQLAASAALSPKQAAHAQIMLWKYMGQLDCSADFDLVYGAEAEAERARLADVAASKLQGRMAGKMCKAHGAPVTYLPKGKRIGFCDLCKPVEAPADVNAQLEAIGAPTIQTAAGIPENVMILAPVDGKPGDEFVMAVMDETGRSHVLPVATIPQPAPFACAKRQRACDGCVASMMAIDPSCTCTCHREQPTQPVAAAAASLPPMQRCPVCGSPIFDSGATCHHASAMNEAQRRAEKSKGLAVCTQCDQYMYSGMHRCAGKPQRPAPQAAPVADHPVLAFVDIAEAAGIGHLIDPQKVADAVAFMDGPADADLASPMAVCTICGDPLDAGKPCRCGHSVAQAEIEAPAPAAGQEKPASTPQRSVAGLSCTLQPATDALWESFRQQHLILAAGHDGDDLEAVLDRGLAVAARLAKAEAKAGHLIGRA